MVVRKIVMRSFQKISEGIFWSGAKMV